MSFEGKSILYLSVCLSIKLSLCQTKHTMKSPRRHSNASSSVSSATIKYKKAPQAPRRFKSAYMFYSTQKHKDIRKELKEQGRLHINTTDVAKMVSKAWKALSEDQRKMYHDLADADKERYETERQAYQGPWKVAVVTAVPKSSVSSKHQHQDQSYIPPPKRPLSAFLEFCKDYRSQQQEDNKKDAKHLALVWKALDPSRKQVYLDQEAQRRRQYQTNLEEWHAQTVVAHPYHHRHRHTVHSNSSSRSLVAPPPNNQEDAAWRFYPPPSHYHPNSEGHAFSHHASNSYSMMMMGNDAEAYPPQYPQDNTGCYGGPGSYGQPYNMAQQHQEQQQGMYYGGGEDHPGYYWPPQEHSYYTEAQQQQPSSSSYPPPMMMYHPHPDAPSQQDDLYCYSSEYQTTASSSHVPQILADPHFSPPLPSSNAYSPIRSAPSSAQDYEPPIKHGSPPGHVPPPETLLSPRPSRAVSYSSPPANANDNENHHLLSLVDLPTLPTEDDDDENDDDQSHEPLPLPPRNNNTNALDLQPTKA